MIWPKRYVAPVVANIKGHASVSVGHALGEQDSPSSLVLQLGVADGLALAITPRM